VSDQGSEVKSDEQFVCAAVIEFSDGGQPEAQIMHTGTLKSCFRVRELLPALVYAGSRPDPKAMLVVIPKSRWDADTVPIERSA
jgi:hypothetical protein